MEINERRTMTGFTQAEKHRLEHHMALEEERDKQRDAKFEVSDERMRAIEEDLRPLRALYWAVMGSGTVGILLISALLYIYNSDKQDIKAMQSILYEQGIAIKVLITNYQTIEKDTRREVDRIDKRIEGIHIK